MINIFHQLKNRFPHTLPGILLLAASSLFSALTLSSCFTGVEGTKKITISRDDRKVLRVSEEEEFFKPVAGQSLKDWESGKIFIAADDRAAMIFDQDGLPYDHSSLNLEGKTLIFDGVETRLAPDGSKNAVIRFRCGGDTFRHDTGKPYDEALVTTTSDAIPMLIDMDMIQSAKSLLKGKKLYTRTSLWYDAGGNRIRGKKYIPVTIQDVTSGTLVFPIKVKFTDEDNHTAWAFMNFGTSGKESRSFQNLFYLNDLRKKYPAIDDEVWQLICNGHVRVGMTKEECKLSLGNPQEVDSGRDFSQTLDLWNYSDGTILWFEDGLLARYRR